MDQQFKKTLEALVNTASTVLTDDNISEVTVASGGISITLKQKMRPPANNEPNPNLKPIELIAKALLSDSNNNLLLEIQTRSREILGSLNPRDQDWAGFNNLCREMWGCKDPNQIAKVYYAIHHESVIQNPQRRYIPGDPIPSDELH